MPIKLPSFPRRRDAYPADLWTKCPACEETLFNKQLDKALRVCPSCGHHFRLSAAARLEQLLDEGTFAERDAGLVSRDALGFVDQKPYPDRLAAAQLATGLRDAAVWGTGRLEGIEIAIVVMDFGFMGGSMGAVVGEKFARAAEAALADRLPLVIVSSSGGARMQEGTLALMQLAKTMAALERLREARVPFVSVLTDPTTGGVFASFAAVGDVNLAEPNALIGFAGARVAQQTIAQELPPGFQRAEFLFAHGFIDRVVARPELRRELAAVLRFLEPANGGTAVMAQAASGFSPLGFLSSLAAAVLPEGEPEPAPAAPSTSRAAARAATNGRTGGRVRSATGEPVAPASAAPAAGAEQAGAREQDAAIEPRPAAPVPAAPDPQPDADAGADAVTASAATPEATEPRSRRTRGERRG